MTDVTCPNCGCAMRGKPCAVCGYVRRRPTLYPIGHDTLTDSYQQPAPAHSSAADLSSDSATGDGRERGVPGRRSSGEPDRLTPAASAPSPEATVAGD